MAPADRLGSSARPRPGARGQGDVAVPHLDRFVRRPPGGWRFAERHRGRLRGLGVLGIDESTALVVVDGVARVRGAGAVTVGDGRGWRTSASGEDVDLHGDPRPFVALRPAAVA